MIENKNILIAYFSHNGENYLNGKIKSLTVGNTEIAAKTIQNQVGGCLHEIKRLEDYPKDYYELYNIAKKELSENSRPALLSSYSNPNIYNIIFLGYPNWIGTLPMIVLSFLEKYDFSNKIIIPFCTHEGGGLGYSEREIKKICPNSRVLQGLAIYGSRVREAENEISDWINELSIFEHR